MGKLTVCIFLLVAVAFSTTDNGNSNSSKVSPVLNADRLRKACVAAQEFPNSADSGVCLGYLAAVMDTFNSNAINGVLIPDTFPPSSKASGEVKGGSLPTEQLERMVVKFVNDHPEREQESGSSVVLYLIIHAGDQSK